MTTITKSDTDDRSTKAMTDGGQIEVDRMIGPHGVAETTVEQTDAGVEISLSPWVGSTGIGDSAGGHPVEKQFSGPVVVLKNRSYDSTSEKNVAERAYVGEITERVDEQTLLASFETAPASGEYSVTFSPASIARDNGDGTYSKAYVDRDPDEVREELRDSVDDDELIADGGVEYVDDDTIKDAIDTRGDLGHPDEPTVKEIRDLLATLHIGTREGWASYMDQIEDGTFELVAETDDLLVLSTGEVAMYDRELKAAPVDVDERALDVVGTVMHAVAGELTDYDWGYSYPLVVRKRESFDAGQRYVEAVVNGLQARGLSPGQAWAYYGVEICDNSQRSWGLRKGDYDNKNVGDALETAREKLPELPAF